MQLRLFQDSDTQAVINLIDGIYQDYGMIICLEDAEADLTCISDHFPQGTFMAMVNEEEIVVVTVAIAPCPDTETTCELKRLYLHANYRGGDSAERMLEWAYGKAKELNRLKMELWSDVYFERAHRFYEKHCFTHDGTIRKMHDAHEPYFEKYFVKMIKG